jgi:signal transduction histidine kinase
MTSMQNGEMEERVGAFDWSRTPIGPASSWSPALRAIVPVLLANRFPHLLWWGDRYIQIYNDAYRPVLGHKHPAALGQPASECWSEIWHVIGALIDTPYRGGPATWDDDLALEVNRRGFYEESHFTIAYSPVPDETAPSGIGGVLATVHEITAKVIAERRIALLRELGAQVGAAKDAEQACAYAADTLSRHRKDVPFALLYLTDPQGRCVELRGVAGAEVGASFAPHRIALDAADAVWALRDVQAAPRVVANLTGRFADLPRVPWNDAPKTAVIVTIPTNISSEIAGYIVFGISPRIEYDRAYEDFIGLARTQIAQAIGNARAYEEERRRATALAELDRAKTAFFSNVSHEFRTPLTLMLGPLEDLLAGNEHSGESREQLQRVHRNALRLLKLVNTLLDFSRIEAGRIEASYQPTDLAAFTGDLASVFRSAIEKAGLQLRLDIARLPEPVYVDRDMWEKIVLNLLSNAFKFTFDGAIGVTLRCDESHVELSVSDTGVGIDRADLERVFERFHRVKNVRSRTHEGSGIGLALVHELVKLHAGTIDLESQVGHGSTFHVRVPRGKAHLPPERINAASTLASTSIGATPYLEEAMRWLPNDDGNDAADESREGEMYRDELPVVSAGTEERSARVLVADDNADMRDYLQRLLARDYYVEVVADGDAAWRRICADRFDLLLTDVMMPRLDGFGLLAKIRADARTRSLPVVMLSARAGEEARIEGLAAGANAYLVKPFSARELLARVSSQLEMAAERRRSEQALRYKSEQFATLLNRAPLGVFLADAELRIREVNPIAAPTFGDIPGGVVGRRLDEVLHLLWERSYADEMLVALRRTLETGRSHVVPESIEYRIDRAVTECYERRLDRILLPDGEFGVVCYFRDVSAQVKAREALEEADRRKDEFLATLSHELRNPLAPLRNGIQILKLARNEPLVLERTREMMDRQVAQLARLIDDLLDVSRITYGKIDLERTATDIASIVDRAVEACRPAFDDMGHMLTLNFPDKPIPVLADPARLAQVFANLLNNACKFTPRNGRIRIEACLLEGNDRRVRVTVADNGIGMTPDVAERVFGMFEQGDRSARETQGGLGIGLTLARRLVNLHGGTLSARSAGLGLGSEFVIELPLSNVASLPGRARAPSESSSGRAKILIVDDNQDAAESLRLLLAMSGNDVTTANSGEEALRAAKDASFDVVILDIAMPGLSGYDTARALRRMPSCRHVLLIAMTGFGQPADRKMTQLAGFDEHLVKPADPAEVMRMLRTQKPRPFVQGS